MIPGDSCIGATSTASAKKLAYSRYQRPVLIVYLAVCFAGCLDVCVTVIINERVSSTVLYLTACNYALKDTG